MAIDVAYVLSGGVANEDIDNSFGGPPSSTIIVDNIDNNLFADVTGDQVTNGLVDFRCFTSLMNLGMILLISRSGSIRRLLVARTCRLAWSWRMRFRV